jgi:hypothetical protein
MGPEEGDVKLRYLARLPHELGVQKRQHGYAQRLRTSRDSSDPQPLHLDADQVLALLHVAHCRCALLLLHRMHRMHPLTGHGLLPSAVQQNAEACKAFMSSSLACASRGVK